MTSGDRPSHRGRYVWPAALIFVVLLLHGNLGLHVPGLGARGSDASAYAFLQEQPGQPGVPVTYLGCPVIHVHLNDAAAPAGSQGMVESAVQEIDEATGMQLVVDGRTAQLASRTVIVDSLAPTVLVAWTTPEQDPMLAGDVVGRGGSATSDVAGRSGYVGGQASLDAPELTDMMAGPDGYDHVRAVVLHELGHVLGLAHVDDPGQVMNPDEIDQVDLGAGDRRGLAIIGTTSGCRSVG